MKTISRKEQISWKPAPAFTLVELLAVMAIIIVILGFSLPVTRSLFDSKTLDTDPYSIADIFEQARSYAMGNNTYVFLGIAEYDSAQPTSVAQTPGVGRVVVMAVASADGTSIYDPNTLSGWSSTSALITIMAPQIFNNLHIANYTSKLPTSGPMARPGLPSTADNVYNLSSLTTFSYPLVAPYTSGRFPFTKVITFDPQGAARLVTNGANGAAASDAIPQLIELDLQQTHGDQAPGAIADTPLLNYAALQCTGMTGSTRVYK